MLLGVFLDWIIDIYVRQSYLLQIIYGRGRHPEKIRLQLNTERVRHVQTQDARKVDIRMRAELDLNCRRRVDPRSAILSMTGGREEK